MTNFQPLPEYCDLRVDPFMSQERLSETLPCSDVGDRLPPFLSFLCHLWSLREGGGRGGVSWTLALLGSLAAWLPSSPGLSGCWGWLGESAPLLLLFPTSTGPEGDFPGPLRAAADLL